MVIRVLPWRIWNGKERMKASLKVGKPSPPHPIHKSIIERRKTMTENKGFFKYLSYKNEPRWLNFFIHVGFGVALVSGIVALILTYL